MKLRLPNSILLLVLVSLIGALACSLPAEDEERPEGMSRQALEDLDEPATRVLWKWYLEQGIEPCDPPPDPWHPFVKHGFCSVDDVHHEVVPNASYDE
jgi:hypothetical protein